MRILDQILGFISKNKKNIFYILLFIVYFFHSSDLAFAETKPEEKKDVIIQGLNGFLSIVASLLGVLTMFIGLFLRPEWTSGSIIGLDSQLKTMWILISNIVYFVFAGIFITIAFMNIIGHGDHYELKKAIPKFIVGVLIVPFSWFFVQFILSISSILTVGVLSLPFDTFNDLALKEKTIKLCPTGKEGGVTIDLSATGSNVVKCKGNADKKEIKIGDFIKENDNGGLYSIMTVYTYGVMRLDETGLLFGTELDKGIKNVWGLSVKLVFDLLFLIVYTLLLVALFLAFMTRGFALWFYVMFSPVFGLLHYFGKGKEGMGGGASKKFNLTEFIGLAMVPVYVAAALSFGVLFLHVAGKGFSATSSGTSTANNSVIKIDKDSATIGNNTFTFPAGKTVNTTDKSTLFGGFTGPLGTLMIQMLGLAVMWLAVMSALKTSSITANVTDPISQFGDQIGKLVAKAPTYAPILPGGMSAEGLKRVGAIPGNVMESKVSKSVAPFQAKADQMFGVNTIPVGDINTIRNKMGGDGITNEHELSETQKLLRNMAEQYGTNSSQYQQLLKDFNQSLKGDMKKYQIDDKKALFDTSGRLTKEGTDLLFNQNGNTTLGQKQFDSNYAGKVLNGGAGATAQVSSQSGLPSGITKTTNGDNINVNIAKLDKDGKETPTKVDINVNKGKVDNLSELEDVFKTHSGKYNQTEFEKILSDIGITDKDQIKSLIKAYFNR